MKVYLDNCSYNRPFDDQGQNENWDSPHSKNKITIEKFFRNATTFVDIDEADMIEGKANEIMKCGVKANDALHLACAIAAGCDYFITTDDGILKKCNIGEINVCSPIEFITIWESLP